MLERALADHGGSALNQERVLADDQAFGRNHRAICIDPRVHTMVGIRRWHAVAIALTVDHGGRLDRLGVRNEAIEGRGYSIKATRHA